MASLHRSIWQDLRHVDVRQRWVDAGGVSTRVLEAGFKHEQSLIMIHGTGGHAEAYARNLAAHAEHFHTYSIDMVGHGWSDKPLDRSYLYPGYTQHLLDFLDAEGIDKVNMSGESMGGGIVGWFTLTHPERVDRLVLNTGVAPLYDPAVVERLARLSRAAVAEPTWDSVKKRLEWLMHDPGHVNDDLIATRLAIYSQASMVDVIELILKRLEDEESRQAGHIREEQWRSIEHPALVLWTDNDPTAPPSVGERVADLLPNGQFALMEGCGHWPQWEDPETFDRIHLEFLTANRP